MQLSKPQKLIYDMDRFAGGAIANICGSILFDIAFSAEELVFAINRIIEINDALRIRVSKNDDAPSQTIDEFKERDYEVLSFDAKADFKSYAEEYAREPMELFGSLCNVKIIYAEDKCGVLIKLHHLIGDAWSLALIGTQLNAVLNGEAPEAFSYSEYVANEEKYITSKRYDKDKEFFLEQFKKCDEATLLLEKHSDSFAAERKTYIIDKEKTTAINNYCNKNEISTFSLLMSALGVYFNRTHMNAEHFYVGTAVLNRTSYKEKNTAGMFINTVPVLIELSNDQSFKHNSESIQDGLLSVLRHQKYNYGDILADIREEFNFTEKLYDVMLSYQNAQIIGDDNFESAWYHCGMQTETLQIHIDDRDNEGVLEIHYDYLTDKLSEKEICRMHEHIFNLLFDGIENDGKKIYELNILSKDEKQKLLFDFNDTAVDYPKDKLVHQLFEEQAEKTPDKDAVIACDKTLTYKELNEEANVIAHSLIEKRIDIGDIVAFALPRKSYLISTMLGILKSGAAYLPIDPEYPQDRIEYILEDSKAKFCITEDNIADLLDNENAQNPCINMANDNICYCIYTSGSTGKPKGMLLTHKNVVNYCQKNNNNDVIQKIVKNDYRSIVSVTTVGFDIFVTESLFPLLNGLKIVFANEQQSRMQKDLSELLIAHPVDVMQTTPTKMKSLISNTRESDYLGKLKAIILGGEVLDKALVETLQGITTAKIFNIYGPTEATVWVTNTEVINANDITIGRPIANTQIYVVDKHMKTAPIGVTGELCIAGDGVGVGYLNRPELTAEKFIDNPFGEGKLYKTGDLAYWREDGNIVYVGRNDFQVKIRGLRIELGEIENAISSVEGILQSVVIVRKNNEGRQLICAFYTGKEAEPKEIRTEIGKKLPKYMLPHIFTHLEEMPLTTSGKINRKALPEGDLYAMDTTAEYITPQTEKEKNLASAIAHILKIDKVGLADNFFDLGGDSLKAIELISKLEKQGYHTDTKTIFACDTVKELAERLTAADEREEEFKYPAEIPATSAQMRVYTAQSMNADSTMYNVPYVFKAKEVDFDRLQKALNALLDRHEILRTCFENKDGAILQKVDANATCNIERLASDDILAFIRPFDLTKAPLIRVGVYENTVMIDMHHIITDGGSMPVFLKELNELYMGRTLDTPLVPYKRFAVTPQDHAESEKYWLEVYKDDVPELTINTDFKRGQKQSFNGSAIYDSIEIELHNKIQKYCKKQNITPYVFYMAAFNILLSKFSGCEDIVVGMPISGRNGRFLDTIGMFVNTIALRNKPIGTKTVEEFLQEVKENSVDAIEHQDYPFGDLVKKLGLNTSDRNPLFDVMFAYQSEQMTEVVFGDEKTELLPIPITTSKYDFTFNILPREDNVVIMAEYCSDLYKEQTVQRFISGFRQILTKMLSGGELKNLSAVLPEEKQKLLFDFNDTAVDYPRDKCVHQLFEEQVQKTPDKVAVIACDKALTYKELNEEANKIAHSLIEKGVGVGDIVAFALPRKSYLISTIFGILKSGAAYLPIDPDYPKDRVEYLLKDSESHFYITDDNIDELLDNKNIYNPSLEASSDNLCYCIFTSGSTGKPKGVRIKNNNLVNFISVNSNNQHSKILSNGNVLLSTFKYCFDAFNLDFALFLANGKTIQLVDDESLINGDILSECISGNSIDIIHTTPSIISILINNKNYSKSLKHVKYIVLGAENFNSDLFYKLSEITDASIFNGYGPSETTIGVSYSKITSAEDITIGKPIANTQIYIVDKYMQPTPFGVSGELCIAGDCVGAGYLNRPELTAEKFIDNPFGEGKLYKTGDLAYWREDGNIVYVGRNDFQVKIRGLRIELGEIENAISAVEGILQSVVIVRKNNEGRQLICAFYTGQETDPKEIRAEIGKKLPKYMLPHIFTHLSEMPLTTSGKINRKALPGVDLYNIANDTEFIAPTSERQKELCKLMEEVLKTSPIGIADDFFDLGGDSLKAIEFVSKAHSEGIYFNLQNVFDYPTVEQLCDCIENGDKQAVFFADVDFGVANEILAKNTLEQMETPMKTEVGNILLAGATGYLGIHILADYLDNDEGTAYCIVRGKYQADSEKRLADLLRFYFGNKYDKSNRIKVYCGDLLNEHFNLPDENYNDLLGKIDTVINCAASVKHYGSYQYFYDMNVANTKRLIDFTKAANAKLIHTSTLSVSGNGFGDDFGGFISKEEKHFYESSLYIGQPLDNVYARSKFEAEKLILEEIKNGLQANIMRMGNLTNRNDGKFQINYESNAFAKRVKGVVDMGMIPDYLVNDENVYCEFTPIDEAAKALLTIARHFSNEQTIFHINSINVVHMDKLVDYLKRLGFKMNVVDGKKFTDALRQTAKDSGTEYIFETFIHDMNEDDRLVYDSNIRIENGFTVEYLKRLGFEWSKIGFEYIKKYFDYFKGIGYICE